jgi:nucleoid-associated protein YgaU
VVTRRQKLLAAGLVLAAGAGLSWPLRRTEPLPVSRLGVTPTAVAVAAKPKSEVAVLQTRPSTIGNTPDSLIPREDDRDPFAEAPAAVALAASTAASVFTTISQSPPTVTAPGERHAEQRHPIHVVHEGDSLDRLARRYLDDEGRALEIFDLNRDVLDNPHVLRIGVELRIPPADPDSP